MVFLRDCISPKTKNNVPSQMKRTFSRPHLNDSLESQKMKELSEFTGRFQKIRIVLNKGPNMGNQTAAITTIERIRELGFKGQIELCYPKQDYKSPEIKEKLSKLIAGFNKNDTSTQWFEDGKLSVRPVSDFKPSQESNYQQKLIDIDPVEIVISVADDTAKFKDCKTQALKWNARSIMMLNPTDFTLNSGADKVFTFGQRRPIDHNYAQGDAALISGINDCENADSVIKDSVSKNEIDEKLGSILRTILKPSFKEKFDFLFLYGLKKNFEIWHALKAEDVEGLLVEALAKSQNVLQKPVVLFSIAPLKEFDNDFYSGVAREFNRNRAGKDIIKNIVIADYNFDFESASSNDVIIMPINGLPRKVFDSIVLTGTLPAVVEGANATALLEAKAPYLHAVRPSQIIRNLSMSTLQKNGAMEEDQNHHIRASKILEGNVGGNLCFGSNRSSNITDLSKFLIKAGKGDFKPYFKARQESFLRRYDKVSDGLFSLMNEGFKPGDIISTLQILSKEISKYSKINSDNITEVTGLVRLFPKIPEDLKSDAEVLKISQAMKERFELFSKQLEKRKDLETLNCDNIRMLKNKLNSINNNI